MTLKEFTQDNTITAVEIAEEVGIIFNVYVEEAGYGLDIDTTNITNGTPLSIKTDFTIQDNILTVENISIDMTQINML